MPPPPPRGGSRNLKKKKGGGGMLFYNFLRGAKNFVSRKLKGCQQNKKVGGGARCTPPLNPLLPPDLSECRYSAPGQQTKSF